MKGSTMPIMEPSSVRLLDRFVVIGVMSTESLEADVVLPSTLAAVHKQTENAPHCASRMRANHPCPSGGDPLNCISTSRARA